MQLTDFSEPFRCRRHLGRLCLRILLRLHCQRSLYHCGLCQRQVPGPRQIRVPGSARDRPAPHPRMVTTYARYRAPTSPGKTGECRGSQQPVETADGSGKNGAAADRLIDAGRLRPSEVIYRDNSPGQHESGGVQWSGPGPDSLNPDHIRRPPPAGRRSGRPGNPRRPGHRGPADDRDRQKCRQLSGGTAGHYDPWEAAYRTVLPCHRLGADVPLRPGRPSGSGHKPGGWRLRDPRLGSYSIGPFGKPE